MANIHVVPVLDAIYHSESEFKHINLVIKNQNHIVGEATLSLLNCKKMVDNNAHLYDVAAMVAEDMHLALSALSKHPVFSCNVSLREDMQCRVPIVAYISRIYVYPKYRKMGFGTAFVQMIPDIVENITMSRPKAVTVYVCPQSKEQDEETSQLTNLTQTAQKEMRAMMEGMFTKCGYFHPSKAPVHSRCMCWIDGDKA